LFSLAHLHQDAFLLFILSISFHLQIATLGDAFKDQEQDYLSGVNTSCKIYRKTMEDIEKNVTV